MPALVKAEVLDQCIALLQEQLSGIQDQINALKADLGSETKSSAGDKHETGRAMIQLEQERLGAQYSAAKKQWEVLQRIPKENTDRIVLGALARISDRWYYFATGMGSVTVSHTEVMVIGLTSPLAQALKGMPVDGSAQFRGNLYRVQEVL